MKRSFKEEMRDFLDTYFEDKHTGLPALVESFDSAKQMAAVKILYKESYLDDDNKNFDVEYPVINNVPVQFPRFGKWAMTFPITKGDPCWLNFSSRSIDDFLETDFKTIVQLRESRTMDINDAIATFEFSTAKNKLENYSTDSLVLRTKDNSVFLEIKENGTFNLKGSRLNIGSASASKALALAEKVNNNFTSLSSYIGLLTTALAPGSVVGIVPPPAPSFTSNNSTKVFTND
jgi:hypothetical protein